MSLQIRVDGGPYGSGFDQSIAAAAEATLQDQGIRSGSIAIVLKDESGAGEFNRRFAGVDQPTDVLSFPDGEIDPDTGVTHIGDVIVCPPVALSGASIGRHALLSELCLLTVHGVLHLLGYEHDNSESRDDMWEAQGRILRRLGDPIEGNAER